MHLPLRPIFRQSHPNFISVRTAYASKIWAQLTKNLLAKSSTKRFREYIMMIPGSKGHKSGASLLAGGFVTLGPAKNMSKKPFFEEK